MTIELKFTDLVKFNFDRYAWPSTILERIANGNTGLLIEFYKDRPHVINIHNDTHIFKLTFSRVDEVSLVDFSYKERSSLINQSYIITNLCKDFPAMTDEERTFIKLVHGLDFSLIDMCKEGNLRPASLLKIQQKALRMGKEYQQQHLSQNVYLHHDKVYNWIKQNEKLISD